MGFGTTNSSDGVHCDGRVSGDITCAASVGGDGGGDGSDWGRDRGGDRVGDDGSDVGGVGGQKATQNVSSGISSDTGSSGTLPVLCCRRRTETLVVSSAAGALLFGGVEGGPVGRGVFVGELGQEGGINDEGGDPGAGNDIDEDIGSGVGRFFIPMISMTPLRVWRVSHIALKVNHFGTEGSGPVGSGGGSEGSSDDSGGDGGGDGGGDVGNEAVSLGVVWPAAEVD